MLRLTITNSTPQNLKIGPHTLHAKSAKEFIIDDEGKLLIRDELNELAGYYLAQSPRTYIHITSDPGEQEEKH